MAVAVPARLGWCKQVYFFHKNPEPRATLLSQSYSTLWHERGVDLNYLEVGRLSHALPAWVEERIGCAGLGEKLVRRVVYVEDGVGWGRDGRRDLRRNKKRSCKKYKYEEEGAVIKAVHAN